MGMIFNTPYTTMFAPSGETRFQLSYNSTEIGTPSNIWTFQNFPIIGPSPVTVLGGTIASMYLSSPTGGLAQFDATLIIDPSLLSNLNLLGLNGLVYVSGKLSTQGNIAENGGGYYHNDVAPPPHILTFSFGVPDSGSTVLLIGLAFLGLGVSRRRLR